MSRITHEYHVPARSGYVIFGDEARHRPRTHGQYVEVVIATIVVDKIVAVVLLLLVVIVVVVVVLSRDAAHQSGPYHFPYPIRVEIAFDRLVRGEVRYLQHPLPGMS